MNEIKISESVLAQIEEAGSMEDIARILSAEGIDVSQLPVVGGPAAEGDELDEAALDNVAGGISWKQFKTNLLNTLRTISGPIGRLR